MMVVEDESYRLYRAGVEYIQADQFIKNTAAMNLFDKLGWTPCESEVGWWSPIIAC